MVKSKGLSIAARKNALAYYVFFAINAIVSFVASPLLLSYLGGHSFGLWKTAQKILDFASVADGRSTQALKWIIANHESSSDDSYKRRMVGSALRVWLFFLPLLLLLTSVLVAYLPDLIKGASVSDGSVLFIVGIALGLNIILAPVVGVPDAVLIGVNQGYKSTLSQGLWLALGTIAMVLLAYLGYGIAGVAIAFSSFALLNGLSVLWLARKSVPWFGVDTPDRAETKSFLNFSGWVLLWMVVERGLLSLELILLGAYLGSEAVTEYTFTSYLVQFGVGISLLTGSAITPGLGRIAGENDRERLVRGIALFRQLALFLVVVFGAGLLLLNKPFVTMWAGADVYMGDYENLLIALLLIQVVQIRSEAQLQDLSLSIREKVVFGIVVTVLSILLVAGVDYFYEITPCGILAAVLVSRLPLCVLLPILVNRSYKLSFPVEKYGLVFVLIFLSYEISLSSDALKSSFYYYFVLIFGWLLVVGTAFLFVLSREMKAKVLSALGVKAFGSP